MFFDSVDQFFVADGFIKGQEQTLACVGMTFDWGWRESRRLAMAQTTGQKVIDAALRAV